MKTQSKMRPIHPGEILREEFLSHSDLSANALAGAIGVPANRLTAIMKETRGISADTAYRLAAFFDTTPEFWMNLQAAYELRSVDLSEQILAEIKKSGQEHFQHI